MAMKPYGVQLTNYIFRGTWYFYRDTSNSNLSYPYMNNAKSE